MSANFYDRLAARQGDGSAHAHRRTNYPIDDPEAVFEHLVRQFARGDRRALDVGCGDGHFTVRMAEGYGHVVGIDASQARIEHAAAWQTGQGAKNVTLLKQDARSTTLPDASFDVIYCRRGPAFFSEYYRLLVPGGHFLYITIGNRDAVELKDIFGRGQDYRRRDVSRLEEDRQALQQAGFQVLYLAEYSYDEYYASPADFRQFLQGVPIFEDFDPATDAMLFKTYVARFNDAQGIRLPRHRVIEAARKGVN